jgi:DNA-binding beta-propeller fold protein YncE
MIGSLHTGAGAEGVSINRTGTLALVANHAEGSISLLSIQGHSVTPVSKLMLAPHALAAHVAFTPDGHHAIVTRDSDNCSSLLDVDADTVRLNGKTFHAGLRPAGLDISPDGRWAVVANLGGSEGDADTVSLIALGGSAPHIVDTVTVGQTPEGVMFSPDGQTVGVTVIGGSNDSGPPNRQRAGRRTLCAGGP